MDGWHSSAVAKAAVRETKRPAAAASSYDNYQRMRGEASFTRQTSTSILQWCTTASSIDDFEEGSQSIVLLTRIIL